MTGQGHNVQSLMEIGERIWDLLERKMNGMNGFTIDDDDLPSRFFNEEGSSGALVKISPIDREEFLQSKGELLQDKRLI